jgi:hypothetical protein
VCRATGHKINDTNLHKKKVFHIYCSLHVSTAIIHYQMMYKILAETYRLLVGAKMWQCMKMYIKQLDPIQFYKHLSEHVTEYKEDIMCNL